jgi:NAD(P)-dependent dehydrogenase (short-subunit alcohol dehydrogenase family)
MRRLDGKVIMIAGGGAIGGELARRYAQEGGRIALGDIDSAGADAVVEEIRASGGQAIGLALNGAEEASVEAAVQKTCETFGGLDGLHVNFSSFADGRVPSGVLDISLDVWDEVIRVNAKGSLICTRAALPHIIARGGGAIVYTSSGRAHRAAQDRVAYAMSKAATHALMRTVAARHGPDKVRANVIAPGTIMHEKLAANTDESFRLQSMARVPIGRLGMSQDIAAMGALLLSDDGAFVTGQVISVDGGATMRS